MPPPEQQFTGRSTNTRFDKFPSSPHFRGEFILCEMKPQLQVFSFHIFESLTIMFGLDSQHITLSVRGFQHIKRDTLVKIDRPIPLFGLDRQEHTIPKRSNRDHFTVHNFAVIIFGENKITNVHFLSLFLSYSLYRHSTFETLVVKKRKSADCKIGHNIAHIVNLNVSTIIHKS